MGTLDYGSLLLRSSAHSRLAIAAYLCIQGGATQAFQIETDLPDVKIRWDNTIKYSNAFRVHERSSAITADAGTDDGDRNFGKGMISNRLDLMSEFDLSYKNVGLRMSGAAWYDDVYNKRNDNDSPLTSNNISVPFNRFTDDTRKRMGRKGELLDAFVFAKGSAGDMSGTVRLGRHSLVFGESLFFGSNGIANAQGPIDLVKLLSVPSSQFKEVLRPVSQLSGNVQLTQNLSAGAYYQFRWEKSIIPPAGSYLSTSDISGEGAESAGPFIRSADIKPRNSGQGGVQLKYRVPDWNSEIGLYAARYHEKTPNFYLTLAPGTFAPQNLVHAYAEGIRVYGASASTTVGSLNIAGEVSVRDNVPLVSDPQVVLAGTANNRSSPAYAVGKTAHAQISVVHLLETSSMWQGGSFLGEIAWNRRLSISQNPGALDPNTTRDAVAFRLLFAPAYYQVLPGLDLNVPIGIGYNPKGKSSAIFAFNGGVRHGGDLSIGITGEYEQIWQFGLNYVHYLGTKGGLLTPPNAPVQALSYDQSLGDRNFISFNVKRTF